MKPDLSQLPRTRNRRVILLGFVKRFALIVQGLSFLLLQQLPGVFAADHLDSPSVEVDGSTDINDLYAFQSPSNPDNVVLIMTVNPLAGVASGTAFNPHAVYEFAIDNTGDAIADEFYRFYFATPRRGAQRFVVLGNRSATLGVAQTGRTTSLRGGGIVTTGVFEDPFFFDLLGFRNGLQFTGDDFFAGANVSAIVLELPRANLGGVQLGIYARTVVNGQQRDRMGRPAINTVLIPSAKKNMFNMSLPVNDSQLYSSDVINTLMSLGNSPERSAALTSVLLPDLLTFNTSQASAFLNGRNLTDDVIDIELQLLTNNPAAGDGVNGNDRMFSPTFPYLASPN